MTELEGWIRRSSIRLTGKTRWRRPGAVGAEVKKKANEQLKRLFFGVSSPLLALLALLGCSSLVCWLVLR